MASFISTHASNVNALRSKGPEKPDVNDNKKIRVFFPKIGIDENLGSYIDKIEPLLASCRSLIETERKLDNMAPDFPGTFPPKSNHDYRLEEGRDFLNLLVEATDCNLKYLREKGWDQKAPTIPYTFGTLPRPIPEDCKDFVMYIKVMLAIEAAIILILRPSLMNKAYCKTDVSPKRYALKVMHRLNRDNENRILLETIEWSTDYTHLIANFAGSEPDIFNLRESENPPLFNGPYSPESPDIDETD